MLSVCLSQWLKDKELRKCTGVLQNCLGAGEKNTENKQKLYQNGQIADICCHAYFSKAHLNRLRIEIFYLVNSLCAQKSFNESKISKDILDFEYVFLVELLKLEGKAHSILSLAY